MTTHEIKPDHFRVKPGHKVVLADWSTDTTDGFEGTKEDRTALLTSLNQRLGDLQQML